MNDVDQLAMTMDVQDCILLVANAKIVAMMSYPSDVHVQYNQYIAMILHQLLLIMLLL